MIPNSETQYKVVIVGKYEKQISDIKDKFYTLNKKEQYQTSFELITKSENLKYDLEKIQENEHNKIILVINSNLLSNKFPEHNLENILATEYITKIHDSVFFAAHIFGAIKNSR